MRCSGLVANRGAMGVTAAATLGPRTVTQIDAETAIVSKTVYIRQRRDLAFTR